MRFLFKSNFAIRFTLLASLLLLPSCAFFDGLDADTTPDAHTDPDTGPELPGCEPGYAGETCEKCANGTYCAGAAAPAVDCSERDGWYSADNPSAQCTPWTVCNDNEVVAESGTSFRDRICLPCTSGRTSVGPNATECVVAFDMVSAGIGFACGVRSADARFICWGDTENWDPNASESTAAYSAVAAGSSDACGIRSQDGKVDCWQDPTAEGTQFDAGITSMVPDYAFKSISIGRFHACGIVANSEQVVCWGEDDQGQVSNVPANVKFTAISVAWEQTCGIEKDTHKLFCWGDSPEYPGAPDTIFHSISVAIDFVCGIQGDRRQLQCWGENGYTNEDEFEDLPTDMAFKSVSVGTGHGCAIPMQRNRGIYCWGYNSSHDREVEDAPSSGNFKTVSVGTWFSCAIREDDSKLVCWGNDDYNQVSHAP